MKKPKDPSKVMVKHTNNLIKLARTYAPEATRKEKIKKLQELKKHYQKGIVKK